MSYSFYRKRRLIILTLDADNSKKLNELVVQLSGILGSICGLISFMNEDAIITLTFATLCPFFIESSSSFSSLGVHQLIDAGIKVLSLVHFYPTFLDFPS